MNRRAWISLVVAALGWTCVKPLPIDDAPCPCPASWTCCPGANVCAKDAAECLALQAGDSGAGDAGARAGTDAGPTCPSPVCTLGATECAGTGNEVSTCEVQSDGCPGWSAPVSCASNQFCSVGQCRCDDADCVRIAYLVPTAGPYVVDQTMEVHGRALDFSIGAEGVCFNSTCVNAYEAGSNDSQLIFKIPPLPEVPPNASVDVVMTVYNLIDSDQRVVRVTNPNTNIGLIDVLLLSTEPLIPVAGQPLRFHFEASSRASLADVYTIAPSAYGEPAAVGAPLPNWTQALLVDVGDGGLAPTGTVALPAGGRAPFDLVVSSVPTDGPDSGVNLVADVSSTSFLVGGSSGLIPASIGAPLRQGSPNMILVCSATNPPVPPPFIPMSHGFGFDGGTFFELSYLAEFMDAGTYDLTVSQVGSAPGWRTAVTEGASQYVVSSPLSQDILVAVGLDADAGGVAEFDACLTREGSGESVCYRIAAAP